MKSSARFAVLLIFLSTLAFSQIEFPQLASFAVVQVEENGTVKAVGGEMSELTIDVSVPLQGPYQSTQTQSQVKLDKFDNPFITFYERSPPATFFYHERIMVQSKARVTSALPESYVLPDSMSIYLSPTSRTQSDDSRIRELAQQITEGSEDQFEKVARLAIWVHQNMEYNEALVGQENDAIWALQNRQGVCVEYTTLFVALSRSIGIPARYVTGYVYSDKFSSWMGHAWAEAYIGQWIPVDPTWFEVGTLDAMHIEASKFPEISREPALSAMVYPSSTTLTWETSQKGGVFANNIAALDLRFDEPYSNFTLSAAETTLPPGEKTLAFLSITGKDYRVVQAKLISCLGDQAITVQSLGSSQDPTAATDDEQFLILRPGKTTTAAWQLSASDNLARNYIYTCPFTLNSPTLQGRVLEVKLDPRLQRLDDYSANVEKFRTVQGEKNSVLLSLPPSRQGKGYYLIASDGVLQQAFSSPSANISFTSSQGSQRIFIAGEGGGFKMLAYEAGQNSTLSIDSFTVPSRVVEGKPAVIFAQLSSSNYPAQAQLELEFAGRTQTTSGIITKPTVFSFPFLPSSSGTSQLALRAISEGKLADQKLSQVAVLVQPKVGVASIKTSTTGTDRLRTTLVLSPQNNPHSISFAVAGKTFFPDGSSSLQLNLPEGNYTGVLSWQDAASNSYSQSLEFSIRKPGILEAASAQFVPPKSAGTCPIPLAIMSIALIGLFFRRR